jgi:integrase
MTNRETPRVLTHDEVRQLLTATAAQQDPRDHVLLRMALGTGLRVMELVALNVGNVLGERRGTVAKIVNLERAKGRPEWDSGRVYLTAATRQAIGTYLRRLAATLGVERLEPGWPLFLRLRGANKRNVPRIAGGRHMRLSVRAAQARFYAWQHTLGWLHKRRPRYSFHDLRHTAIATVYERAGDIEVARIFARHRSTEATKRYAHCRPERVMEALPPW